MSNPDALARLRAMVLADEALADRLALIDDRGVFAAAAAEAATAAGIGIAPDAIEAAARRDPLDLARFGQMPVTMTGWPGRNWLPVAIVDSPEQIAVEWLHFGDARLTESFFESSIARARWRPINALLRIRTPLADLVGTLPADAAPAPDGLIFHMSRCGSTLVAQMMASMPGVVTASEPEPLDAAVQLVHTRPDAPFEQRVALLRAMAAMIGRDRFGDRRHYVIKTDSWHSLALPLFRAAFPGTPWLFLFRDPTEVMVSQRRVRGLQTVPGSMHDILFAIPDAHTLSVEEQIARVLNRVTRAAIDYADLGGGLFLDYADLPHAVERRVLPHFGIEPDADALGALRAATQWNAKSPSFAFEPDAEEKRRSAGEAISAAVTDHLEESHRQLKALAQRD